MADQTDKPTTERLNEIEREISKLRSEEDEERLEELEHRFRFATPEAYEANQLAAKERNREDHADPMEQPTPSRFGNVGHDLLDDDWDDKTETKRAAERATSDR